MKKYQELKAVAAYRFLKINIPKKTSHVKYFKLRQRQRQS